MKLNGYIPLNNLIPNFVAFVVVSGTALSTICCISCVDSSPNLPFSSIFFFFVDELWLHGKKFMRSDICRILFHIRSNAGIMAGNRDLVNQSES